MHAHRYAILLDGGFVLKVLGGKHRRQAGVDDVMEECARIQGHSALQGRELLHIYFYHAPPATGNMVNPLDHGEIELSNSGMAQRMKMFLNDLEMRPNLILQLGETKAQGWTIGAAAMKSLTRMPRSLQPSDLVPNIRQKGVDLRIGLDIAQLALRQLVGSIVVATGDTDLVPALSFARREGIRVYLDHLGHGIPAQLEKHADVVL